MPWSLTWKHTPIFRSQTKPGKVTQTGNRVNHGAGGAGGQATAGNESEGNIFSFVHEEQPQNLRKKLGCSLKNYSTKGSKWMFQEFIKNGLFPGHGQLMNLHIGWHFLTSPQMVRASHLLPFQQRREQKQRSPGYRRKKLQDPTSSSVFRGKYSGSLDGFPLDNEVDLGEEGQALGAAAGPWRKDTACPARKQTSHR